MDVTYCHVPTAPLPLWISSKGTLKTWGAKHARWVHAKVDLIVFCFPLSVTLEEVSPQRILVPPLSAIEINNWVVIGHALKISYIHFIQYYIFYNITYFFNVN